MSENMPMYCGPAECAVRGAASQAALLDVIVVNDFAHVNGGAAKVALHSALGLRKRGHAVAVLAAVAPVAPELQAEGAQILVTNQHDIKSDPSRLRAIGQGIWNPRAADALETLLAGRDPAGTIVHVHGWSKALSSSVVRAALAHHFPVVVTLHDYFYACPNGGFFDFQRNCRCDLRALSASCIGAHCDRDGYPQKLWRTARQVIQNRYGFAGGVDNFISLSDLSEQVLRPYLPLHASIYRVPNPVAVTQSPPADVGANRCFVAVGRLSPEKGFGLLAAAARQLGCEVVLIGDGPSRAEITAANPQVRITGWQPAAEVFERLRAARALVFPSLWYEVQPLAVLEAAALGVPAIVPDRCAARELVEDGVTGLWFRSGDVADLGRKLAQMQDCQAATRMGKAAYDRYWSNPYTMERHLDSLESCYLSILRSAS